MNNGGEWFDAKYTPPNVDDVPGKPRELTSEQSEPGSVTISWTPPLLYGASVSDYTIYWDGGTAGISFEKLGESEDGKTTYTVTEGITSGNIY